MSEVAPELRCLLEDWLLTKRSENTRDAFRQDVNAWLRWCEINTVDPLAFARSDGDRFRDWMGKPIHTFRKKKRQRYAPATTARRLSALAAFYGYAAKRGAVLENSFAGICLPNVPEESSTVGLTVDEARRLLAAARESDSFTSAVVWVLATTGVRIGEFCATELSDLSDDAHGMTLRIRTKGARDTSVLVPPPADDEVRRYLEQRPNDALKGLFTRPRRGRIRDWQVAEMLDQLCKTAGVPHITPHGLRHTCATLMLDSGATVFDVQLHLRHRRVETTLRYDRARKLRAGVATRRLGSLLAEPSSAP